MREIDTHVPQWQRNERRELGSWRSESEKIRQTNSRGSLQAPEKEKAGLNIYFFKDCTFKSQAHFNFTSFGNSES